MPTDPDPEPAQPDLPALRPCPWCGMQPTLYDGAGGVACVFEGCPARPCVGHDPRQASYDPDEVKRRSSVARWNMRAS